MPSLFGGAVASSQDQPLNTSTPVVAVAAESRARRGLGGQALLLLVLAAGSFLATSTGVALSPFLLDIARDLQVDLAAAGNLVSTLSITWGIASLVAGSASDRLGRRPVLVFGVTALGLSQLGVMLAPTYHLLLLCQLLGGLGGGSYMGTVFATVSDQVPPNQRGRALGWIITGQSLSLVLGVPIVTFIGTFGGWRGAVLAQGLAMLATALAVRLVVPGQLATASRSGGQRTSLRRLLRIRVLALLGAGTMERLCFGTMAVFLASYLITSYDLPRPELALGLALVALGNLGGNLLGSQLTDRLPARPLLFAASSVATGLLGLPLLLWQPGVVISLGLGFAYALTNALGRPALMASLSEVPSDVRGAVLGLNITAASFGWIGATALGGQLIRIYGFGSLGLLAAGTALLGAGLALVAWMASGRTART